MAAEIIGGGVNSVEIKKKKIKKNDKKIGLQILRNATSILNLKLYPYGDKQIIFNYSTNRITAILRVTSLNCPYVYETNYSIQCTCHEWPFFVLMKKKNRRDCKKSS